MSTDTLDEYGDTPLIIHSREGNLAEVKNLLKIDGVDPLSVNNEGSNALIEASQNKRVDIVRYLLNNTKIDPNHRDKLGCTALISAVGWLDSDVVLALLDCSEVDPNLPDNDGDSPLHYLCLKNGRTEEQVELSLEIMQILIEKKKGSVNLNSQNYYGVTPLLAAVADENDRVVEYLVQLKDVNKDITSNGCPTAIEVANRTGNDNICRMLTF